MHEPFRRFSSAGVGLLSSGKAFLVVVLAVVGTGWWFHFSPNWLRWVGFLMSASSFALLFLLRKAQAVGEKATQLKLDELIRAVEGARNHIVAVEERSEGEIESLRRSHLAEQTQSAHVKFPRR